MAKINSGILGAYSGTIKKVTGYRRKGVNIITGQTLKEVSIENSGIKNQRQRMINARKYMDIYLFHFYSVGVRFPLFKDIKFTDIFPEACNDYNLTQYPQIIGARVASPRPGFLGLKYRPEGLTLNTSNVRIDGVSGLKLLYPDIQAINFFSLLPAKFSSGLWNPVPGNFAVASAGIPAGIGTASSMAGTCIRSLSANIYSDFYFSIRTRFS